MIEPLLIPKFLTQEVAISAVFHVTTPFFAENSKLVHPMCHIVVLVPSMKIAGENYPHNYQVEPHLLYERSFGKDAWPTKFDEIAQCKALQLWHDRNDGRTDIMSHLLFQNDTPYWGGVKRDGIVVACAGFHPWLDKMVSGMVADMCIGMAYNAWMTSEERENNIPFLI